MDDKLITKKELLDQTGISYGSLYRWKRKSLIPDDWFIHRATYTGHETFFPKDKILARISEILEMKGDMSLDEIAVTFNPSKKDVDLEAVDLPSLGVASRPVIDLYLARYGETESYDFDALFPLFLFSKLMEGGALSRDETFLAIDLIRKESPPAPDYKLLFLRKIGICTCLILPENDLAYFDCETTVTAEYSLRELHTELANLVGNQEENN